MNSSNNKMSPYKLLGIEVSLHFIVMYAVMYTMVNTAENIYFNLNNLYMTGMMVAPMVVLMLLSMKHMFPNKRMNRLLVIGSLSVFIVFYFFERKQTFIDDKQFIKSMIPHHSGAVLMCNESSITDLELKKLCESIVDNQQKEIDQMKQILLRL